MANDDYAGPLAQEPDPEIEALMKTLEDAQVIPVAPNENDNIPTSDSVLHVDIAWRMGVTEQQVYQFMQAMIEHGIVREFNMYALPMGGKE